jgi:hypothetical protein
VVDAHKVGYKINMKLKSPGVVEDPVSVLDVDEAELVDMICIVVANVMLELKAAENDVIRLHPRPDD